MTIPLKILCAEWVPKGVVFMVHKGQVIAVFRCT